MKIIIKGIILFFAASVILGLHSCVSNENIEPQQSEIWYNLAPVKQNSTTKAAFSPFDGTFGTFAYKFEAGKSYDANKNDAGIEKYIDNAQISKQGGVWKGATSYFWPKDGSSLTFFSYAPYDNLKNKVTCTPANGIMFTDYKVSAVVGNLSSETDLLVADVAKDLVYNAYSYFTSGVPTLFKHKLCTVQFLISYANEPARSGTDIADADKIEITSFQLQNIYTQGDFVSNGWTNLTSEKDYPNSVSSKIELEYDFVSSPARPVDAELFGETMMIPQPTNSAGGNPPTIIIGYTKGGVVQAPAVITLYTPSLPMWEAGKKIIYRISISTKDEYIEFSGTPSGWDDLSGGDINVGV
ncbi:MAG: fimbrillin family protein [Bacteroidales bacterium]|nr:fimbrillin family protein [Bacteroidales bacterium]